MRGESRGQGLRRLVQAAHLGEEATTRVGAGGDLGQEGQGAPGRHLIEDDAEAVDVAALVAARRVHELLGGHVGGGAEDRARDRAPHPFDEGGGGRLGPGRHHSRDAEVGDADGPVGADAGCWRA